MPESRVSPELIDRSFGLVAIVENTRVVLPLKAVECEFSVAAGLVAVRMTQIFRQENPKPLDCDYLFPLPADASVYCCEADINGRIIRAKVKERGEAVRLAAEKKAEGRRVALVEAERENLFTLSLKNLQPDDLVLVTLKYIQPLRHLADMPSVEIPFCPGIRYIPGNPLLRSNRGHGILDDTDQVPDASRISPVRLDREHPDAAFINIQGRLDAQFVAAASLVSPSHHIISRPEGDQVAIRLSDHGEVPDRDFILRWKESNAESLTARAWMQEVGGQRHALLEIRAPKATGAPLPMDFYFLVDISGSMAGLKWQKAALAVQTCVSGLAEQDRVMLTLFNNGVRDFAEQPLPPTQLLADANFRQLQQLRANGGTEMAQALRHVLELAAAYSPERNKALILVTDAQVGNEGRILKIAETARDFPVHCFGLDIAVNDALLLALARQQRGTAHLLNPGDDVAKIVGELAQSIRHPVLHDLSLSAGWEPDAKHLPPLYSGQVFHLAARCAGSQPLELSARNGAAEAVPIPIHSRPASGEAPYLHWCKRRMQRLMAERNPAAAIALSVQSNLICPLTAFIAWDESEKVAVASHSLAQPNLMEMDDMVTLCASAAGGGTLRGDSERANPRLLERCLDGIMGQRLFRSRNTGAVPADAAGLGTTHFSPGSVPPYQKVVEEILSVATGLFASQPATPYPDPKERTAAFEAFFRALFGSLPGLEEPWRRIMQWAFADAKSWLERSTMVARLLRNLQQLADRRQAAFELLSRNLIELANRRQKPGDTAVRLLLAIKAQATSESEALRMIEAEFKEGVDSKLVADYRTRIPSEIQQVLETFITQQVGPNS